MHEAPPGQHYIWALWRPLQAALEPRQVPACPRGVGLERRLSQSTVTLPHHSRPLLHHALTHAQSESLDNVASTKTGGHQAPSAARSHAASHPTMLRLLRQDASLGSVLSLPTEELGELEREGEEGGLALPMAPCERVFRTVVLYVTYFCLVRPNILDGASALFLIFIVLRLILFVNG